MQNKPLSCNCLNPMYSLSLSLSLSLHIYVMEWWSVEGQDTSSGVRKNGDHSRHMSAIGFYLLSSRQFLAHPKSSHAHIDKRMAWAARNTHYHYSQKLALWTTKWLTIVFPWPAKDLSSQIQQQRLILTMNAGDNAL